MIRRVVIVDDSEQCAVLLEIALAGLPDIALHHFSSAREALRYLADAEADGVSALVTDLNMPAMDGFELIRRVRADARYARLPIVVLSADPDPRARARTQQLGADAFFAKPFSPAQVRHELEGLLHGRST